MVEKQIEADEAEENQIEGTESCLQWIMVREDEVETLIQEKLLLIHQTDVLRVGAQSMTYLHNLGG